MYVWLVYDLTSENASVKMVASTFAKAIECAKGIVLDNNDEKLSEDTITDILIAYWQIDDITCITKRELDKEEFA